jgi:hypothetical protein
MTKEQLREALIQLIKVFADAIAHSTLALVIFILKKEMRVSKRQVRYGVADVLHDPAQADDDLMGKLYAEYIVQMNK